MHALQSQQKAIIDSPPDALNLTDAFTRQRAAKKAHNVTQVNNAVDSESEPPKWLQQVMQFQMAPFGGGGYCAQPELPTNPHTPLSTPSTPLNSVQIPGPSASYTPTAVPSSPSPTALKRPADDVYSGPIIFPDVDVWLSSLDSHPMKRCAKA